jgi:hypothetical protein
MKVIWLSNLLIMSVPDEGYLAFQSFDYVIMSVPDEGYLAFQSFDYERT